MSDNLMLVRAVANLEPVTKEEVAHLHSAGLIYTDGWVWQLTEAGRFLLLNGLSLRNLDSAGPVVTTDFPTIEEQLAEDAGQESHHADTPLNVQVGGSHYKKLGRYQPWEVLAHWLTPEELRGYMKGTVIAYLARERDKGGDIDIEKSAHTMELWQALRKDKP